MLADQRLKELSGWDALNLAEQEKLQQRYKEQLQEYSELFHSTFSTPPGEKLLDLFIRQTLMQPVIEPMSSQFQAGIREGQNAFVRQILGMIDLVNTGGDRQQ